MLDHRERFGNHIHSSLHGGGLADKHSQAIKQLTDLGVKVLVSHTHYALQSVIAYIKGQSSVIKGLQNI